MALLLPSGFYVYARNVGIEISTTAEAFAIPAITPVHTVLASGAVEVYMDITPASWPDEAKWIYRLAWIGIPVKVDVAGRRFVVRTVDTRGHLVIDCASLAEAKSLLLLMQ